MSVGLRKSRLLLRGNVWQSLMAATAAVHGAKLGGACLFTTASLRMVGGIQEPGGRMAGDLEVVI